MRIQWSKKYFSISKTATDRECTELCIGLQRIQNTLEEYKRLAFRLSKVR